MRKFLFLFLAIVIANIHAKTITDHNGVKNEFDQRVKRVLVQSGYPLPAIFAVFDGGVENIIAIPKTSAIAAKYSMLSKMYPDVLKLDTSFDGGSNSVNAEAIIKLKPDVIFYYADNKVSQNELKKIPIPSVGFGASIYKNNAAKVFEEWIKLMGELSFKDDRATEVINHTNNTLKMIEQKTSHLKNKPTAMIIMRYKNRKLIAVGKTHYGEFWLNSTGAKNAFRFNGLKEVSLEEIYRINPDIIYITNFTPLMPNDMQKPVDGLDFTKLKAVKNKQVFKFPLGLYRYYPPNSEIALSLMFLAKHNHPDIFKDLDLKNEIKKYYSRFYNYELSDAETDMILNPDPKAGDVD